MLLNRKKLKSADPLRLNAKETATQDALESLPRHSRPLCLDPVEQKYFVQTKRVDVAKPVSNFISDKFGDLAVVEEHTHAPLMPSRQIVEVVAVGSSSP